ncbi:MAG: Spy/CpxP family protein refolding chaperone [Bradyrhizobium sp.]|nr:Spy/CpxP family protein refolding chaperone [Bradyrhizobium sp.]
MRKFAIAGMAALAIAASSAVYAGQGWFREHMQHMRLSPEDRAALVDARIAAVHAGLKLTPDQERMWPPVEAAVRDFAKLRIDRATARMEARERAQDEQQPREDPVTRLRQRADNLAATGAGLKKIADAADPLYKSLDEGQKRRLAMLTRGRFGGEGWRRRWMERDGREGTGGDDDGGPEQR